MGELIPFATKAAQGDRGGRDLTTAKNNSLFRVWETSFGELEHMLALLHSRMEELQLMRKSLPVRSEPQLQRDAEMLKQIEDAQERCRVILGKSNRNQER